MFYRLKKGLMCRALEKRNKEKPFDYSYAENFTLDGETDALLNNSYYFSAHSGESPLIVEKDGDHIVMNASKGTIQCLR